jgi:hypothetical protein
VRLESLALTFCRNCSLFSGDALSIPYIGSQNRRALAGSNRDNPRISTLRDGFPMYSSMNHHGDP